MVYFFLCMSTIKNITVIYTIKALLLNLQENKFGVERTFLTSFISKISLYGSLSFVEHIELSYCFKTRSYLFQQYSFRRKGVALHILTVPSGSLMFLCQGWVHRNLVFEKIMWHSQWVRFVINLPQNQNAFILLPTRC